MKFAINKSHIYFLKKTARSLNFSFSILPGYVKFMLSYAYLIARAMDSVVDESNADWKSKKLFLDSVKKMIFSEKEFIENSLKESVGDGIESYKKELVMRVDEIITYFLSNLTQKDIFLVRKFVCGIFEGMMMDLEIDKNSSYISDIEKLDRYVSLIGGIPALYWYDVYRSYNHNIFKANFYSSAYRIGKALQYVNILRDIGSDIRRLRCYIPFQYLKEKNIRFEDLKNPANILLIKDFIKSIIITSIDYLDESEKFISSISSKDITMRLSLIWPVYWAMDTLYLVWQNNPLALKVKISKLNVYKTLLKSPLMLSDSFFSQGYRFRREVLMLAINS